LTLNSAERQTPDPGTIGGRIIGRMRTLRASPSLSYSKSQHVMPTITYTKY